MPSIRSILNLCILYPIVACSGCQSPIADLTYTQGTVNRSPDGNSAQAATAGETLTAQEWLVTQEESRATVSLRASQAIVELEPNSVLVLPSDTAPMSLQAGQANITAALVDVELSGTHLSVEGVATIRRGRNGNVEVEVTKGQMVVNEASEKQHLDLGTYIRKPGGTFESPEPEPEPDSLAEASPTPELFSLVEVTSETLTWRKSARLTGPHTGLSVEVLAPPRCGKNGKISLMKKRKPTVTGLSSLRIHLPTGTHRFLARCRFGRTRMQLTIVASEST
ncbi:MAG: hypothetical protein KTR25_04115 [Myxococcales bacterium]|nr:hypothetical protein [Myxococcales bacterium]